MGNKEVPLGKYRHYKGKLYEVIGVGYHTESLEKVVIYRALYEDPKFGKDALWVRPKEMFLETVEVEGEKIPRFIYVED